jgi:3-dehydroquinate synthase
MSAHPPAWARDLRTVRIRTTQHDYDVAIGPGAIASIDAAIAHVLGAPPRRAMLVYDDALEHTPSLATLRDTLGALDTHAVSIRAQENLKSLDTLRDILIALAGERLERNDLLVALGGGIVGDVAGFAAATYRRGIPVIQCPTTLLAMVDASVGGKTGVNLELPGTHGSPHLLKNVVGAFHQPRLVIADLSTLDTLDQRQFTSGLAECVKHAMIGADWDDPTLLEWTRACAASIVAREPVALRELVERNVYVKARVVSADERETAGPDRPGRMLLNLGHTFGHAIETAPGAAPAGSTAAGLLHGEAVALGLLAACTCAATLGLTDDALATSTRALLTSLGLPTSAKGLPPTDRIIDAMRHDKKAGSGRMRVVLPVAPGRCRVVEDPDMAALARAIDSIRST